VAARRGRAGRKQRGITGADRRPACNGISGVTGTENLTPGYLSSKTGKNIGGRREEEADRQSLRLYWEKGTAMGSKKKEERKPEKHEARTWWPVSRGRGSAE